LGDLQPTVYPHSGHLSTIDWAQVRESTLAKDHCPNHYSTIWLLSHVRKCGLGFS